MSKSKKCAVAPQTHANMPGLVPVVLSSYEIATLLGVPHSALFQAARKFGEANNISPESMGLACGCAPNRPYYNFRGDRGKQISIKLAEGLSPLGLERVRALWDDAKVKNEGVVGTKVGTAPALPARQNNRTASGSSGCRVYVTSGEISTLAGREHYQVNRWMNRLVARGLIEDPLRVPVPARFNTMVVGVFAGEKGERDSLTLVQGMAPKAIEGLRLLWAQRKVIAWDVLKRTTA